MIFSPFLRLPRWVLTAVCFGLICYLTLVPKPLPDTEVPVWEHTDKLVHAIMFGALYVCAALDIWRGRRRPPVGAAWLLAAAVIAVGGAIELAQDWMALGRGGDLLDLAADASGTLLALALMQSLKPAKQS